ncbi:MAG: M48 family metalloprotease [Phycisphaerae bacterium]
MSHPARQPTGAPIDEPPPATLHPALSRSAFRAEVLSLAWEPLVLLLPAPLRWSLQPLLSDAPVGLRMVLVPLLWAILYVLWMLPITLYRRWWLPRQAGLDTSLPQDLARSVRILTVRAGVVLLLVAGAAAIWALVGATAAGAMLALFALLLILLQRRRPATEPAPRTGRTLPELQQFAADLGHPEVAVLQADRSAAAHCRLDIRDGRSVITLSPTLLEAAPSRVLRAAVAHELAHHEADDLRQASLLGESAVVLAALPALAAMRLLVGPVPDWPELLDALPWALGAYWAALSAAFWAIRAWERHTERRANRRAMEQLDDPAAVVEAVVMVSAAPPSTAGRVERLLWRLLSSHPDPAIVAADADTVSHRRG